MPIGDPDGLPPVRRCSLSRLVEWTARSPHPSRALCGVREQATRRRPTPPSSMPKREKRGKRGACIDPHGYDAGKKIKGKKPTFS